MLVRAVIKEQGDYPKFKGKYSSKRSYRTNHISSTYKIKHTMIESIIPVIASYLKDERNI